MIKEFFKIEDGIETVEFIGMVAVAAVLIIGAKTVADRIASTASRKATALDNKLNEYLPD